MSSPRWITRVERLAGSVVGGEVRLAQADAVELVVPELEGRVGGGEALLVPQHVLHVLGADVAGGHDLLHRSAGRGVAEELGEQHEALDLLAQGATVGGEDLK
jgi:hypothetical protein